MTLRCPWQTLQEDLNELQNWSLTWQLAFNAKKGKVMRQLGCTSLNWNMLWQIDQKMTFDRQVYHNCQNQQSVWNHFWAYMFLDQEALICLYKGLVRLVLEYGVVIWSPHHTQRKEDGGCAA